MKNLDPFLSKSIHLSAIHVYIQVLVIHLFILLPQDLLDSFTDIFFNLPEPLGQIFTTLIS